MRAAFTILISSALLALGVSAQGQIASLDSSSEYCFFLPPMVGGDIAENEDSAIAFCNQSNPKAPGAKLFPPGFVLSANWATGDGWVQITGQIDPTKYSLNPCDMGGQYDIRAPVGASCAGFDYFVNVIEPNDGLYGMKCCQNRADCIVSQSTYGVYVIFGSQANFGGPRSGPPVPGCNGGSGTTTSSVSVSVSPTTATTAEPISTSGTTSNLASQTTATTTTGTATSSSPAVSKPTSSATNNKVVLGITTLITFVAGILVV
ncbi:hypothetical protein BGZ76_009817 [Entomortierella beljakovae]|nr:hypothetical protein BGZ76_009817 [Entomortierella beljakovae]